MNSVGGLKPDTVKANLTGSLQNFWGLLREDEEGRGAHVLNWNGQVAPVVHQVKVLEKSITTRFQYKSKIALIELHVKQNCKFYVTSDLIRLRNPLF